MIFAVPTKIWFLAAALGAAGLTLTVNVVLRDDAVPVLERIEAGLDADRQERQEAQDRAREYRKHLWRSIE